jgi:hypothetical protein
MTTKDHILNEIRRMATDGGSPPGKQRFESETSIREHEWGKYWARWSDALIEAGFKPNTWTQQLPEQELLEKLSAYVRELGRFPVVREMKLKTLRDPSFPSPAPFRRLGNQQALAARLREYSLAKGYEDVAALCGDQKANTKVGESDSESTSKLVIGFVYLMKSGRHYKIGRSVSVGSRERQLAIKIPVPPTTIHSIETDDPVGVEGYWHKRFESKRGEGEWFDLSAEDVKAFKRWKRLV